MHPTLDLHSWSRAVHQRDGNLFMMAPSVIPENYEWDAMLLLVTNFNQWDRKHLIDALFADVAEDTPFVTETGRCDPRILRIVLATRCLMVLEKLGWALNANLIQCVAHSMDSRYHPYDEDSCFEYVDPEGTYLSIYRLDSVDRREETLDAVRRAQQVGRDGILPLVAGHFAVPSPAARKREVTSFDLSMKHMSRATEQIANSVIVKVTERKIMTGVSSLDLRPMFNNNPGRVERGPTSEKSGKETYRSPKGQVYPRPRASFGRGRR